MIGKIRNGRSFKGLVEYLFKEGKNAKLLDAEGVLEFSQKSIINSFYMQAKLNPNVSIVAGHTSLNYSVKDADKLTDKAMVALAREYMVKMGIKDTQYIIVRHHDREHLHIHIAYNRIDNNGKTISDSNDRIRNADICREIKEKYGLYFAPGKDDVKQDRLRGKDKTKYEIYNTVKDSLKTSKNWNELEKSLKEKGVELQFKYKGKTDVVQGILFTKDNITFKGSEVDRKFSYSKLEQQMKDNNYQVQSKEIRQNTAKQQNQNNLISLTGS